MDEQEDGRELDPHLFKDNVLLSYRCKKCGAIFPSQDRSKSYTDAAPPEVLKQFHEHVCKE